MRQRFSWQCCGLRVLNFLCRLLDRREKSTNTAKSLSRNQLLNRAEVRCFPTRENILDCGLDRTDGFKSVLLATVALLLLPLRPDDACLLVLDTVELARMYL